MSYPSCSHGFDDPNGTCPICEKDDLIASLNGELSALREDERWMRFALEAIHDSNVIPKSIAIARAALDGEELPE